MAAAWSPRLATGDFPLAPQDHERATLAPKMTKEEGLITRDLDARRAYDRFRGFTPAPGATLMTSAGVLKLKQARLLLGAAGEPGSVEEVRPDLTVSLPGGRLRLLELQPEGRRAVSGAEFANGARLRPGDVFLLE